MTRHRGGRRGRPAEVLAKAAIVTGTVDGGRRLLADHGVAGARSCPRRGPVAAVGDFAASSAGPTRELR